jgi:hypothetical protein
MGEINMCMAEGYAWVKLENIYVPLCEKHYNDISSKNSGSV